MISSIKNLDTDFTLELELGNVCNFKCSYCFPGANAGDRLWPDSDKLSSALLRYLRSHNRRIRLYLVGGETTLWKDLPKFCRTLKDELDIIITVSTNASKSIRWWKENYNIFDAVHISLHPEESNVEHTVEVADLLYRKDIETNIDVLMDANNFEKSKKLVERSKDSLNKFPVIAKTVIIDGTHQYNKEQLEYLEQPIKRIPDMEWYNRVKKKATTQVLVDGATLVHNGNYFVNNNLNQFEGWICHLGVDIAKIDHAGYVRGNCGHEIGQNIYRDQTFKIAPVICDQMVCNCTGEMCTTKWKIDEF